MSFRATAARSIPRSLLRANATTPRPLLQDNAFRAPLNTLAKHPRAPKPLALALRKPFTTSLIRYQSTASIDRKTEQEIAKQKVPATPDTVSASSSVHKVTSEVGVSEEEHDVDMMAGIRSDFVCLTFSPGGE